MNKNSGKLYLITAFLYPVLFGVLIFVLWQTEVLHKLLGADPFTLPLPGRIFDLFRDNFQKIMANARITVFVAVTGLAAGSVLGYLTAIIASVFPKWGKGGLNIVSVFTAVPIVAMAPVITNLTRMVSKDVYSRGMLAKVIVVTLICTALMSVNAYRGLTELKPFSEDLMKTYAATKAETFIKLRLSNSVPYVFIALKVSVPSSVITALISEYFAESITGGKFVTGVGKQIQDNIVKAQYPTAWSYILCACMIGITLYVILIIVERIVLKRYR